MGRRPPRDIENVVIWGIVLVDGAASLVFIAVAMAELAFAPVVRGAQSQLRAIPYIVAFLVPGLFAWAIARGLIIPRWRLWAYGKVGDIAALKAEAVRWGVLNRDDHWLRHFEWAPRTLREQVRQLEEGRRA